MPETYYRAIFYRDYGTLASWLLVDSLGNRYGFIYFVVRFSKIQLQMEAGLARSFGIWSSLF